MASSIKGITVEIGGNTTKLDQALQGVNSKSKSLQSELNQVNKLLKLDPKNTELLSQKQQILAEKIKTTSEKLKTLKEAQEQVKKQFQNGEIDAGQYRAFERQVQSTEKELKDLQKEAKDTHNPIKKIGEYAKQSGDKMEVLKKAASGVVTGMKAIAAAGAAAGTAVAGIAYKAAQAADDLNTLSKVSGVSTQELQKFQYASDLLDVSVETYTGSLKKLTTSMSNAKDGSASYAEAFDKLGVSVTDANGNLRNSNDVFMEAIDALGQVSNETERDAIAMDIFGKSATELNPLISAGSAELKKLGDQAENLGLILDQDTLDAANKFNDAIDTMKANTAGAFKVLGAEIAGDLVPIITQASDGITNLTKNLIKGYKEGGLDGLVAAAGESLSQLLTVVADKGPALATAGVNLITSLLNGIKTAIPQMAAAAVSMCQTLLRGVIDMLPTIMEAGIQLVVELAKGIAAALPELIPEAVNCILTLVDELVNNIDLLIDAALQLIKGLALGLINALPLLAEKAPVIVSKLVKAILENLPLIKDVAIQIILALAQTLMQHSFELQKTGPLLIKAVIEGLYSAFLSIPEVGANLVKGLWEGITSMGRWLKDKVTGFANGIVNNLKSAFGIHSPSRVMRDQIGKYIAEGVAVGITDSDAPEEATEEMLNSIKHAANGLEIENSINSTYSSAKLQNANISQNAAAASSSAEPLNITLKCRDMVLGKIVISDLKELKKQTGSNPVLSF